MRIEISEEDKKKAFREAYNLFERHQNDAVNTNEYFIKLYNEAVGLFVEDGSRNRLMLYMTQAVIDFMAQYLKEKC